MGKMNTITKDYMSEPKYFADSFNYYLFDGKQVIQSENLQVLDPTEMALIPKDTTVENVEKIRDVLKQCVLMADDKLKPLITLTIYFGPDDWDAPRSLKDMFETTDETILQFVEDYRVHLIVPKEIEDFSKFATDFGKAMRFIAASKDPDAMDDLQRAEEFQSVDIQTVQLLNACTNSKIPVVEGEEDVNMCKGLDDLMERHRREERVNMITSALNGGSTPEVISKVMCIPIEEVNAIANQNESIIK